MPTVFWDIETRSTVPLEDAGAWRYAADPTTEVLCVGYAIDDGEPKIWIPGQPILEDIISIAKQDPADWVAHNFMFERAITTHKLTPLGWPEIPLARQICSMSLALAGALPGALDNAAAALGFPQHRLRRPVA
jgi:DNA polymerase